MNKEYWLIVEYKNEVKLMDKIVCKNLTTADKDFHNRNKDIYEDKEKISITIAESKRWLN